MAQYLKKSKSEIGLSPQELVFRGNKKIDQLLLRLIDFDDSFVEEKTVENLDDISLYLDKPTVTWFNIDGLHDIELLKEIGEKFKLPQLLLADVLETNGRPKLHEYEDWIYISMKMLHLTDDGDNISVQNLSLVFKDNALITFQEKKQDVFEPVRQRIKNQKRTLRSSRTDYLAFALIDTVIDHYLYILSTLGDKIESFDNTLLDEPDKSILEDINSYKKQLNLIRKGVKPAKDMILVLSKLENDFIHKKNRIHFKELVNNINQVSDSTDAYRELLSDQLNIYHMMISSKLNDIMKFLTIFSVIFIPLTFIAGIYGTNFDFIPELHHPYGYFFMLISMLLIVILMLFYFKKKKWL